MLLWTHMEWWDTDEIDDELYQVSWKETDQNCTMPFFISEKKKSANDFVVSIQRIVRIRKYRERERCSSKFVRG